MSDYSKPEFDKWYFGRFGQRNLLDVLEHAKYQDAFEIWKAAREDLIRTQLAQQEEARKYRGLVANTI